MRAVPVRASAVLAAAILSAACTEAPTRPASPPVPESVSGVVSSALDLKDWLRGYPFQAGAPAPGGAVLVGAGDIAECYHGSVPPQIHGRSNAKQSAAEETAKLLDRIPGTVMAVGDNAYQFGSTFDYEACYDPTWGRHFDRTRPATGNHEYMTPGAAGYFAYFRERAVPPPAPPDFNVPGNGYYSYNLNSWHVIVINSTPEVYACYPPEVTQVVQSDEWQQSQLPSPPSAEEVREKCAGDAAQRAWLFQDLTKHANYQCTAVYFHHPRFSSGQHGNHPQMQVMWDMMYDFGVDLVITGHDHNYERFAPQDRDGNADPEYGIREFVVGTGGTGLRQVGPPIPNSEKIIAGVHGVLALALNEGSYGWAFVAVDQSVMDSGTTSCHGVPGSTTASATSAGAM